MNGLTEKEASKAIAMCKELEDLRASCDYMIEVITALILRNGLSLILTKDEFHNAKRYEPVVGIGLGSDGFLIQLQLKP